MISDCWNVLDGGAEVAEASRFWQEKCVPRTSGAVSRFRVSASSRIILSVRVFASTREKETPGSARFHVIWDISGAMPLSRSKNSPDKTDTCKFGKCEYSTRNLYRENLGNLCSWYQKEMWNRCEWQKKKSAIFFDISVSIMNVRFSCLGEK